MKFLSDNPIDEATRKAILAFLGRVSARFPGSKVILFGSRARGDFRSGSDADIAVVLEGEPQDFLDTKLSMADDAYDVLLETGVRIQPLPVWQVQWQKPETYSNPRLLHNIEREGLML